MNHLNQIIFENQLKIKKLKEANEAISSESTRDDSELKDVKGIGEATLQTLLEHGISTKQQLADIDESRIEEIIQNPLTRKSILKFIQEYKRAN